MRWTAFTKDGQIPCPCGVKHISGGGMTKQNHAKERPGSCRGIILAAMLRNASPTLHRITLLLMGIMAIWGIATALLPLRPFWIDEWRLIYNLKFKSAAALWGPLAYTQQAPRMYLALLKPLMAAAHYSYVSLRLPSLLISLGSMVLAWRLMQRIFPGRADWLRLLFPLILISSQTFTDYLVQTKHYEAEIFLALLAMWQTLTLLRVADTARINPLQYAALCLSMAGAAPFSYTYPVAAAPMALLGGARCLQLIRNRAWHRAIMVAVPLLLCGCGVILFYITDVSQLMADEEMHRYWSYRMAGTGLKEALLRLWFYFAALGSGAAFEVIFGALGISAFAIALPRSVKQLRRIPADEKQRMVLYSVLLVLVCIAMFSCGKLPLGEAKFNAFCVPALSILIIAFLQREQAKARVAATIAGGLLFAGLAGNIISVVLGSFFAPEYSRRMAIYTHTQEAIRRAQDAHIPLLITPGVAWPDEIVHKVPHLQNMPADAILKTFPAYDKAVGMPVYAIPDMGAADRLLATLPDSTRTALAGDGIAYRLLSR